MERSRDLPNKRRCVWNCATWARRNKAMAKKQKPEMDGPSNAYLMSFGDTMTTLLAFFIVLNSLAAEQTGANLHSGTGSFIQTTRSMGLAGTFKGKRAVQRWDPTRMPTSCV